jgi:thermostable 8-oxoguanine DNA glycosylase
LHQELFDYLKRVGARFPAKDPEYVSEAEQKYLDGIVKNRLPQLEKQRLNFLSKDFDLKNNWWGSKVTKD